MPRLDRAMARALSEAGYMPLHRYIEMFGNDVVTEEEEIASPRMVPDLKRDKLDQRHKHRQEQDS